MVLLKNPLQLDASVQFMEIHRTTRENYRQAAQVLARAFVDEPVSVAVYKNFSPARRVRALGVDFSAELLPCISKGYPIHVNENGIMVGAAVIYPPGTYPLSAIAAWLILINSVLRNGWYAVRAWRAWMQEVDRVHPQAAHYYLEYLGVEPTCQGRGIGSQLLKHLVARADEQGVGCYLENANLRNLPVYQRFGFQIISEKKIIGIPSWFMWRPPVNLIMGDLQDSPKMTI